MKFHDRIPYLMRVFKRMSPIFILLGVGLIIWGYKDELITTGLTKENSPYVIMGIMYVIVGVGFFLFRYIESGPRRTYSSFLERDFIEEKLETSLKKIKKEVSDQILVSDNKEIDPQKLDELIQVKIRYSIENTLKEEIEKKYGDNSIKIKQQKTIEKQTNELQIGVNNQIGKLSRSGTINLIIGLITTLTAIWILASLVLSVKETHFQTTNEFLVYLLPRFTLAIFIEIFSFFFLRLYKRNLEDVKYFHNERTNIDSKIIALNSAILIGKEDLVNDIIKSFSNVERNFVLKKDESTINLERIKLDTQQEMDIISKVTQVIEKLKK